jgi:CRP-like cAMP-binding protein
MGGFDGARCLMAQLGGPICDPGLVTEKLQRLIDARVRQARRALAAAAATTKAKRRGKLLHTADRRLTAIARRVTKLGRAKKKPLDPVCRDRILGELRELHGVMAELGI